MKRILSLLWRLKRGFTLIEILIAVTLLIVIAVAAFSTFRGGTAAWRQGTVHAQRDAEARATLEMMTRELSKAILIPADGDYQIDFFSAAANIYFIGSLETPEPGQPDIVKVRYFLDGEEIRRATANIDTNITDFPTAPLPPILASHITYLGFEFFDNRSPFAPGFPAAHWRDNWDSRTADEGTGITEIAATKNTLPGAIRITFISDPDPPGPDDGLAPKTFSTDVAFVMAEPPFGIVVSLNPSSGEAVQANPPSTVSTNVTVTLTAGAAQLVNLSIPPADIPAGVTHNFPASGIPYPSDFTVTRTFEVSLTATPGTHPISIQASSGDNVMGEASYSLNIVTPPVLNVTPATITGSVTEGTTTWVDIGDIIVANPGGGTLTWVGTETEAWLDITSTGGTVPGGGQTTIDVLVRTVGLVPNPYTADIIFTGTDVHNNSVAGGTVTVNLTVTPIITIEVPATTPTLTNVNPFIIEGTMAEGAVVTLSADTAASFNPVSITGAGTTWTSEVTLIEGSNFITATAAIGANTGSASTTIVLDTLAPAPPLMPDLAAADDTGISNIDNITKLTTDLTFSGTAEANSTVELFAAGTVSKGTVIATTAGNWTFNNISLAAGDHSITAKAKDAAGNTSTASAPLLVTIDTTPPAPPLMPDLAAADDTGISNIDNITKLTTDLTFSGTAEANSTVELFAAGTVSKGTVIATTAGNWTFNNISLAAGDHSITAKAKDAAGNTSAASAALSVTIDTTAPTVTIGTVTSPTPSNTQTINGTMETGATVAMSSTTGVTFDTFTSTATTWSVVATLVASSNNNITATAQDAAGNTATDTATITTNKPPAQPTNVSPAHEATGVSPAPTLTASAFSDPDPGDTHGASLWRIYTTGGAQVWSSGWTAANLTSITVPIGTTKLLLGTSYKWTVRYRDNRGVESVASVATTFTVIAEWSLNYEVVVSALHYGKGDDWGVEEPTWRVSANDNKNAAAWGHKFIWKNDDGPFWYYPTTPYSIHTRSNTLATLINIKLWAWEDDTAPRLEYNTGRWINDDDLFGPTIIKSNISFVTGAQNTWKEYGPYTGGHFKVKVKIKWWYNP